MEAVEHEEEYAARWRERQQALMGEAVWLQKPVFELPHRLLLFPRVSVKRCKIQIRRCQVDTTVTTVLQIALPSERCALGLLKVE